jgi:hypothetical protein
MAIEMDNVKLYVGDIECSGFATDEKVTINEETKMFEDYKKQLEILLNDYYSYPPHLVEWEQKKALVNAQYDETDEETPYLFLQKMQGNLSIRAKLCEEMGRATRGNQHDAENTRREFIGFGASNAFSIEQRFQIMNALEANDLKLAKKLIDNYRE